MLRTMDDFDYENKRVIIRVDLNSPVVNGKVLNNPRIKQHAKTINELVRKKARVIILSHQGRPGNDDFLDLKQHYEILKKYVKNLKFINDVCGNKAIDEIIKLKPGESLLLDNVRFVKDEMSDKGEKAYHVEKLSLHADFFVNDAFSSSHRAHASIIGFPKLLPSAMGRVFEKEVRALEELKCASQPIAFILGGAKIEDSVEIIKSKHAELILTGGVISLYGLFAKGFQLGKSEKLIDKKFIEVFKKSSIITPLDIAYEHAFSRCEILVAKLPIDKEICDIGEKTIREYKSIANSTGTIVWNGPMGVIEKSLFRKGSEELAKAIAKSKAYSLICGGHTIEFVEELGLINMYSHVSLSGGAMLQALAGKKLPGLKVLEKY